MKNTRPILGLTMGDPAGIGPEICLRAMTEPAVLKMCTPVLFGDLSVLNRVAEFVSRKGREGRKEKKLCGLCALCVRQSF